MCVIVHKPSGETVSKQTLADMWRANPHGAGLAYLTEYGICVDKGLMTLAELERSLDELGPQPDVVFHLRVATHGRINRGQTHPFVIAQEIGQAKGLKLDDYHHAVVFHNGVISGFGDDDYSDTLRFVTQVLSVIPDHARVPLLDLVGSKFVVFTSDGTINRCGTFHKVDGLYVSNKNWRWASCLPAKGGNTSITKKKHSKRRGKRRGRVVEGSNGVLNLAWDNDLPTWSIPPEDEDQLLIDPYSYPEKYRP